MAKAKARKSGASRRQSRTAKTTRPARRTVARKPTRKTRTRKQAPKKTAPKPASRARAAKTRATTKPKVKTGATSRSTSLRPATPPKPPINMSRPKASVPRTHTGSGAGVSRSPYLERERRRLREIEEGIPTPPSSLDLDRSASAVRTGRAELTEALHEHTETSPALTGGDVDADWQNAASSGDEAPGGDNPTPDQQRVDDIGKALGLEYQDNEELQSVNKVDARDKHRWELDPASAEDYRERQK